MSKWKRPRETSPATLCVYCNRRAGTTDDHIPAKTLFPSPRPGNMVTVPSCETCRQATTKDDEYFRFTLVTRWDVGDRPSARAALAAVFRSLSRSEASGFRREIIARTEIVDVTTSTGVHLATTGRFKVDDARVERVVGRIVWGLFAHHYTRRLGDEHAAAVFDGQKLQATGKREEIARLVGPLQHCNEHTIGEDVFAYRFLASSDEPYSSAWLLRFYGTVEYLVLTLPRTATRGQPVVGIQGA